MPKFLWNMASLAVPHVRVHDILPFVLTRISVHGEDFMSGGPRSQQERLEKVMDKHESKHTMMGASSDLGESLVMLNRRIVWQDDGIAYIPDKRDTLERVVDALNL